MKRFEFSLKKLLSYKEQVLRREKNDLAALRQQQQLAYDEKERVKKNLAHADRDFAERSARGMTPQQIMLAKGYINQLLEQLRRLDITIENLALRIEKQLSVVVEATKEVSSLEKLQDKQFEEYNKSVQKAEETFIGEYVSNSQFYREHTF